MIRKLIIAVLFALLLMVGIIVVRTMSFAPSDVASGNGINLSPPPEFDLQKAAANLGEAVRFQTVSHQDASDNDISQWAALHTWLQITYPVSHSKMKRQVVAERTLIYSWTGSEPALQPIILMAHQDVVPVTAGTEKDWKHPPYSGEITGDAIWGRGTVDDKGSLVSLFEALEALAVNDFQPKRTIYLVSGHDEEVGGGGARVAAAFLAEKGIKALLTIDEGSAVVTDAPVINSPAALIGIAEKGYATLKITANSVGGHSSMPPANTGVVTLAKAIIAINDNSFPLELYGPGAKMVQVLAAQKGGAIKMAVANEWLFGSIVKNQISAIPSGAALMHTTIAPTMLEGSPKENVLPQSANALINYRIAPWNSSADIMARAKSAVDGIPVTLSWVSVPREPSKISSTSSLGWKYVVAAAQASSPDALITPYLVVAATDSRSMQEISDDVYRFMPTQFSLKDTAMIHGTNEHITLDNLKRAINFYAHLIVASAG